MISVHVSGRLVRNPEDKVSKSGRPYTQALLLSVSGDSQLLVTLMAFDPDLQALLSSLKKGDGVSAMGNASIRAYTDKEGQPAALEHARQAGELLIEAKAKVGPHGKWGKWIEENCEPSRTMINKYMQLANEWESFQKSPSGENLGLNAALKQLAADRRKEKQQDFPADTPDVDDELPPF